MNLAVPKLYKRLLCCAVLALPSAALAECTLGTPVFSDNGPYLYTSDLEQGVRIPFNCTALETPQLSLSSSGGVLDPLPNRFLGTMRNGAERLKYSVLNSVRTLEAGANSIILSILIPKNQWGAPSLYYTDTLTVVLTF